MVVVQESRSERRAVSPSGQQPYGESTQESDDRSPDDDRWSSSTLTQSDVSLSIPAHR